ncbi:hypothetical protein A5893_06135 [Pedobacter psychrophilus]|uniref:Uncharacterized protein n=1 Tax=Pedobacter psychrophilus TaxID=1826909 RepID=A0A179DI07_9SPHI|nr:hypothetical protein [Pedobacter psychrophilus]OAQ40524.1 hypothetical protein A5893_06135 [Pedobacter psychrophilus]
MNSQEINGFYVLDNFNLGNGWAVHYSASAAVLRTNFFKILITIPVALLEWIKAVFQVESQLLNCS